MGRLTGMPSRLGSLPHRLAAVPLTPADRDRERASFHPYRAWYKTKEWLSIRARIFLRDLYTCQRCGKLVEVGAKVPEDRRAIANHRRPHRGDRALFLDESNIETVCKPCHDGPIQREEQAPEHR